jgi:hypothetical protein
MTHITVETLSEREVAKTIETSGRWLAVASPRPSVREFQHHVEGVSS